MSAPWQSLTRDAFGDSDEFGVVGVDDVGHDDRHHRRLAFRKRAGHQVGPVPGRRERGFDALDRRRLDLAGVAQDVRYGRGGHPRHFCDFAQCSHLVVTGSKKRKLKRLNFSCNAS